ncbi:histone deacetylase domain-containing protein [Rhodocollybia butyracea]|uniref:Histone deacetylase domain-containing protein n=1 Tax=Rhodocollybia butyracea TaxID=206335 RepID=A0A9P5UFU9_9AGAR|nr:histone deacetylase domain-containing protein [Rhodocollybia butyracea]
MANTSIFIQDACYQHRYIRSRDTSLIVELPERLVAVKVGLAAAIARIQELTRRSHEDSSDLVTALENLTLESANLAAPINVVHSAATLDLLNHPAVQFTHAFPDPTSAKDPNEYLKNLKKWSEESTDRISKGESEIPQALAQGDLYLCPESLGAIQGALGTVCESIDTIVDPSTSSKRAFVAIRPPGHHCGEDTPSGFCFVNNVIVGSAHAHLKHGIHRIVIFDIDLHHGNGTQSLAWAINEENQRLKLEAEAKAEAEAGSLSSVPGPLQIYYSSIHDVLSYPCEDGTPSLVQAASASIAGGHGQWIENVHLQKYEEEGFWGLYEEKYKQIIRSAEKFVQATASKDKDDVLVFISCGFDASEHEYASMSRHGRKVPTTFYAQFTNDVRVFADKYAKGRIVSVLEGGYSDRALTSGAFAHLCALGLPDGHTWNETWWAKESLDALQDAIKTKKPKGRVSGSLSTPTTDPRLELWLSQTLSLFQDLEPVPFRNPRREKFIPTQPSSRTLRQRKVESAAPSASTSAKSTPTKGGAIAKSTPQETSSETDDVSKGAVDAEDHRSDPSSSALGSVPDPVGGYVPVEGAAPRKLPRVILKLGPEPASSS